MPAQIVPRLTDGKPNDALGRRRVERRALGGLTVASCGAAEDMSAPRPVSAYGQPVQIDGHSTIGGSAVGAAGSAAGSFGAAKAAEFHGASPSAMDGTSA